MLLMMFGKHHYTICPNDIAIFQSQGEAFNSLKIDSLKNKDLQGVPGVFKGEVNEKKLPDSQIYDRCRYKAWSWKKRTFGTEGAR